MTDLTAYDVTVDIAVTFTVIPGEDGLAATLERGVERFVADAKDKLEDEHNVGIFRYDDDIDDAVDHAVVSADGVVITND